MYFLLLYLYRYQKITFVWITLKWTESVFVTFRTTIHQLLVIYARFHAWAPLQSKLNRAVQIKIIGDKIIEKRAIRIILS